MTPRFPSPEPRSDAPESATSPSHSATGLILRLWWMMLGNGALAFVLVEMASGRMALPSLLDAAFAALVASLAFARFADVRWFAGRTADGARATSQHFKRYALRLLGTSAAGWGAANVLAMV